MKPCLLLFATLILSFSVQIGSAQVKADPFVDKMATDTVKMPLDSLTTVHPKKSHFEASLDYQSNDVYLGRKDSTVLPYFIPALSYYHKSGLYATVSLNYLKNTTDSRVDLVTFEAGYMFHTGLYTGQLSFSKYFYNSQSTSVTAELKESAAFENSYDFGFIKTVFTGTLNIGSKLDFSGVFGLEHSFYLFDEDLDLTPTLSVAASTQNYYNDYYRKRRYSVKRKGETQTGIATITGTVLNASSFKLLDYELTMPINYTIGKCTFNFTPTYSIPVNAANIAVHTVRDNGQVLDKTKLEKIGNTFYWTVGVSFLF
jgi:hypothetical protein